MKNYPTLDELKALNIQPLSADALEKKLQKHGEMYLRSL